MLTRIKAITLSIVVVFAAAVISSAQVDLAFDPVVSGNISAVDKTILSNGKMIVWSESVVADGTPKGQIARLNADGSLDGTFNYCGCHLTLVTKVIEQADGRLLVSGVNAARQAAILRLNTDGSLDSTFISGIAPVTGGTSSVTVWFDQDDGKAIAEWTIDISSPIVFRRSSLIRLNTDGSIDSGFASSVIATGFMSVSVPEVVRSSTGKIFVGYASFNGAGYSGGVLRFNVDGGADKTWEPPIFIPPVAGNLAINGIEIMSDGSVLVGGRFSSVNGVARTGLVKLQSEGNIDMGFNSIIDNANEVRELSDGKVLVSGALSSSSNSQSIFRLNADGSLDDTYTADAEIGSLLGKYSLDTSERSIFFAWRSAPVGYQISEMFRLETDGDTDTTFVANVGKYGTVLTSATASNEKMVIAGPINGVDGIERHSVVRLLADGSVDTSFNAGLGFDVAPDKILVQPDDKVIAVGNFEKVDGDNDQASIARLNANGSFDSGFSPEVTQVRSAGLQTDGKLLIGGEFSTVNGASRNRLARLNSDGSLDSSFDLSVTGQSISWISVQSDGKIILAGNFSGIGGFNRTNIARLNADGTVDSSFNAGALGSVQRVWQQPDGKYIVAEGGTLRRLNAGGTIDNTFDPPIFSTNSSSFPLEINAVGFAPHGAMIVGGSFNRVNDLVRNNIVLLRSDGSLVTTQFLNGSNGPIKTITYIQGNDLVIGGAFSRIGSLSRIGLAKATVAPIIESTPFDFDGDGRADITVFRPGTGAWYTFYNGSPFTVNVFGTAGDLTVPADYDGDGKTDIGIFRPSTGTWWYKGSFAGNVTVIPYGVAGDIPLPSDFDGDGKADIVVYNPPSRTWFRYGSTGAESNIVFGAAGDIPLIADMDGDGKSDPTVFRPSTGTWWYAASSQGGAYRAAVWGMSGDIPVPADYDGDGKTDPAVYRPSTGIWYIINSSDLSYNIQTFGLPEDRPVAADYDGDGKADIALFRPSTGIWYILQSTSGFAAIQWGISTDEPAQASYLP